MGERVRCRRIRELELDVTNCEALTQILSAMDIQRRYLLSRGTLATLNLVRQIDHGSTVCQKFC